VVGTTDTLNVRRRSPPTVGIYSPSTSPDLSHAGIYFKGITTGAGAGVGTMIGTGYIFGVIMGAGVICVIGAG
jgi:hypothetical protein